MVRIDHGEQMTDPDAAFAAPAEIGESPPATDHSSQATGVACILIVLSFGITLFGAAAVAQTVSWEELDPAVFVQLPQIIAVKVVSLLTLISGTAMLAYGTRNILFAAVVTFFVFYVVGANTGTFPLIASEKNIIFLAVTLVLWRSLKFGGYRILSAAMLFAAALMFALIMLFQVISVPTTPLGMKQLGDTVSFIRLVSTVLTGIGLLSVSWLGLNGKLPARPMPTMQRPAQ